MTGRWSKFTGDGSKVGFAFGTEEKALAHAAVPNADCLLTPSTFVNSDALAVMRDGQDR